MTPEPERGDSPTRPSPVAMVIDDNRPLRECTQRLLESAGYEAVAFASGHEALTHAATAPRLDVVVTDLVMGGMSGLDLLGRLREHRPQLPAIIISGHSDRIQDLARDNPRPDTAFLDKPFKARVFLGLVAELTGLPESSDD